MSAQDNRRANLWQLMDDNACWPNFSDRPSPKYSDYNDTYAEMAGTYLGVTWDDDSEINPTETQGKPESDVPKYAATIYDETYTMIGVFDSLTDALAYSNGEDGEYLTGAGSVIDLDTGLAVEKRAVVLSATAYRVLASLIHNGGVAAPEPTATELRAAFQL